MGTFIDVDDWPLRIHRLCIQVQDVLLLEAALELKPRPQVVVILTDGFTPWPSTAPKGVKVVVALIGKEVGRGPEWARVVRVEK